MFWARAARSTQIRSSSAPPVVLNAHPQVAVRTVRRMAQLEALLQVRNVRRQVVVPVVLPAHLPVVVPVVLPVHLPVVVPVVPRMVVRC